MSVSSAPATKAQKDSAVSPANSTIVARLQLELAHGITAIQDVKTEMLDKMFRDPREAQINRRSLTMAEGQRPAAAYQN